MGYSDYQQNASPGFLQGSNGRALMGGLGQAKDDQVTLLKSAVKARFADYAPVDALPVIGGERQIDRGPTEDPTSYVARLKDAWDAWQFGGSAYGMLRQLWAAGLTTAQVVQMNGVVFWLDNDGVTLLTSTLTTVPYVFGMDASLTFWSKFTIVFPVGTALFTTAQQDALRTVVKRWKRGAATYIGATVVQTGALWGVPIETWANDGTWGGSSTFYTP
jgi:hypothetical protein